jgi:hypothetical protein
MEHEEAMKRQREYNEAITARQEMEVQMQEAEELENGIYYLLT